MIKVFTENSIAELVDAINGFEKTTGQQIVQFGEIMRTYSNYSMIVAFRGPCEC